MKHPHAELMMQYGQDAMETDKPWERWEYLDPGLPTQWKEATPGLCFYSFCEYRRKPRTIRIGEYDVPEPCRNKSAIQKEYYIPSLCYHNFHDWMPWDDDAEDNLRLQRGLVHLTREAAELHGRALASLTAQKP